MALSELKKTKRAVSNADAPRRPATKYPFVAPAKIIGSQYDIHIYFYSLQICGLTAPINSIQPLHAYFWPEDYSVLTEFAEPTYTSDAGREVQQAMFLGNAIVILSVGYKQVELRLHCASQRG